MLYACNTYRKSPQATTHPPAGLVVFQVQECGSTGRLGPQSCQL